jgi:hypothetical protein
MAFFFIRESRGDEFLFWCREASTNRSIVRSLARQELSFRGQRAESLRLSRALTVVEKTLTSAQNELTAVQVELTAVEIDLTPVQIELTVA